MRSHFTKSVLFCILSLAVSAPASGEEVPLLRDRGALDEFDNMRQLAATEEKPDRLVLGDANGRVHLYEVRDEAYEEVWLSDYLEGAICGVFVTDVNDDELQEIVVFTDQGRIYYFDSTSYNTLWSNPPGEYEKITAQIVADIDDDPQPELVFCAAGRLIIFDGRDQYEEWRSDQINLSTTDILIADVDGDEDDEIVLNDGYVFDAHYRTLEWQSPENFGARMGVIDLDDDGILELVGEFNGRYIRIFDVDLRREKSSGTTY